MSFRVPSVRASFFSLVLSGFFFQNNERSFGQTRPLKFIRLSKGRIGDHSRP